jgi:aryl-alcohol dehydrogenase-like predicted oxidoreductase
MSKEIIIGSMFFGSTISEDDSHKILNAALDCGIRHIDTAPMYPVPANKTSHRNTEAIIGRWICSLSLSDRLSIKVITKFSNSSPKLPYLRTNSSPHITYNELVESASLSKYLLKVDRIETLLIHWPSRKINNFGRKKYDWLHSSLVDSKSELQQSFFSLSQLLLEDVVSNIGISNESPYGLSVLLNTMKSLNITSAFPVVSNPYSILCPSFDSSLSEFCHFELVKFVAHSPLAFGLLAAYPKVSNTNSRFNQYPTYFSRYTSLTFAQQIIFKLSQLADRAGIPLYELSYRYIVGNPYVSSIVLGCSSASQVYSSYAAISQGPLDLDLVSAIDKIIDDHFPVSW